MAGNGAAPDSTEHVTSRRRTLRSFQERPPERAPSDSDPSANASETPTLLRRSSRPRPQVSNIDSNIDQTRTHPYFSSQAHEQAPASSAIPSTTDLPAHERVQRGSFITRGRRAGGRDSAVGSPSRGNIWRRRSSLGSSDIPHETSYEHDSDALELPEYDEATLTYTEEDFRSRGARRRSISPPTGAHNEALIARQRSIDFAYDFYDLDGNNPEIDARFARHFPLTDSTPESSSYHSLYQMMTGAMKRSRDKFESADGKDITRTLKNKGAVAVIQYSPPTPNPQANDIWPECRNSAKLPARYTLLDRHKRLSLESKPKRRSSRILGKAAEPRQNLDAVDGYPSDDAAGRPEWKLPVELVELIACHLNRDDIKSLRLVSHELNRYVSQVIFKTVVVPFNTEIYGMLGQEPKPDLKGKKRTKIENPGYFWKNANGDEVYNGHGLDVFRGFGQHILRYGMSFEVSEDSLILPPAKSSTEKKTSFWGDYDWPFEEYRRFDTVAGLETAADETPRMKIAFSELSKVKELALSVDSGLGWLNGPDRSIRARILQKPPPVFGTPKDIPDRRALAQQELWHHIEAIHQSDGSDVKLATLYRMEGQRPLSALQEAHTVAEEQPKMPYLDPRLIHEATPHDTADIPIPTSFDDPEVLGSFVLTPASTGNGTGMLFSSINSPTDAGQLMSPIIPANLTRAQKEWLLETEWAQRAFMSSYMLSIIDNPVTFSPVHTLNISRLSARYLPMLNRSDFWGSLPNLTDVTLMVIPEWRTVHKDEAGFVDTPRINPSRSIVPFCHLLHSQVACCPNIRNLTIGWVNGGEYAEGLHARNKLIFPAPVTGVGASETTVVNDIIESRAKLLHLPHLERLTLKNCWITPPALMDFVKIHDMYSLKHLVLDSVSLTAIMRPNANVNANQAAQQAAAMNLPVAGLLGAALWNALNNNGGAQAALQAQAQLLPHHQQFLQIYVQTLQVQLQQLQVNAGGAQQQNQIAALHNQLQQHSQQLQNQNHQQLHAGQGAIQLQPTQQAQPQLNFNNVANLATQVQHIQQQIVAVQPPPVPANPPAQPDPQSVLKARPREGSWMNIVDIISPGTNLSDFDSDYSQADEERNTSLQSIEFISCGYAKLPNAAFDQAAIEGDGFPIRNPILSKRYNALAPAMLSAKWPCLGEIVQEVDVAELAALDAGWNLKTGWGDAEEARAVEFDGLSPGGTGRFSGKVQASDRVAEGSSANRESITDRLKRWNLHG